MTSTISKRLEKIRDIVDSLKDVAAESEKIQKERYKSLCHGMRMLGIDEETIQRDAPIFLERAEKVRALRFANIESED